ncbi:MAG: hypothetical protein ACLS28_14600 [Clostridium neonatale]
MTEMMEQLGDKMQSKICLKKQMFQKLFRWPERPIGRQKKKAKQNCSKSVVIQL